MMVGSLSTSIGRISLSSRVEKPGSKPAQRAGARTLLLHSRVAHADCRLVAVEAVEEKPVRPRNSSDSRHSNVSAPMFSEFGRVTRPPNDLTKGWGRDARSKRIVDGIRGIVRELEALLGAVQPPHRRAHIIQFNDAEPQQAKWPAKKDVRKRLNSALGVRSDLLADSFNDHERPQNIQRCFCGDDSLPVAQHQRSKRLAVCFSGSGLSEHVLESARVSDVQQVLRETSRTLRECHCSEQSSHRERLFRRRVREIAHRSQTRHRNVCNSRPVCKRLRIVRGTADSQDGPCPPFCVRSFNALGIVSRFHLCLTLSGRVYLKSARHRRGYWLPQTSAR